MSKMNFVVIGAALIVFASVATALRFGSMPIGIGEVAVILAFIWALRYRKAMLYIQHPIMLFWMSFIATVAVAMAVGTLKGASSLHTAAAYLYAGCFSLMALACLEQVSKQQFISFIKALSIIPGIMLFIPFLCFLTDSTDLAALFGINTEYPSRLSAWSTNPNQLALLLLPVPFWLLAVYRNTKWQGLHWLRYFGLLWAFFFLGISVRSDALLLAWIIGLPVLTAVAWAWIKPFNWKLFATTLAAFVLAFGAFKFMIDGPGREHLAKTEAVVVGAVSSLFGEKPSQTSGRTFAPGKSDSVMGVGFDQNKSGVRKTLWIHSYEVWLQSPLIGHGPGAFSYLDDPAKKEEAHNLGFDILTQAGIVGVLLFAALYLWLMFKACQARDPFSLTVLVVLLIFSGAHFMLRQPVFSLYMIICALAVKQGIFTALREKPQPN
ncbi:O-antigen ligase family protein [Pseudomonas sp. P39-UII1]|uniref:O-antigen ligase family protein n=1 Tax=Pseudomonas sp. P39-UII1 TaxID=3080333 RepID=UPI00320904D1